MTCYNPIRACYSKSKYAKTGKKDIHLVFHENFDSSGNVIKDSKYLYNEQNFPHALYEYVNLPCRKCVGCRSDNAKMWSLRAYHEMICHKDNCFITLTYNDDNPLVRNDPLCIYSLRYKHFQNFMKRLRKEFSDSHIGYIVSGEYGCKDGRSHWHAILFGFDFPDKELVYMSKGFPHYRSSTLERLWSVYNRDLDLYEPIGFVDLCNVDYDCCSYVSQYVMKKLPSLVSYPIVSYDDDGTSIRLEEKAPPIVRTSKNPAIGLTWFNQYGENAVEKGFCVNPKTKSSKMKTPAYYYSKFEKINPDKFKQIKEDLSIKMKEYYTNHPLDVNKLKSWEESHLYRIVKRVKSCLTNFKF